MVSRLPPEILQDIFKYNLCTKGPIFRSLKKSCLLVNRYWCHNAVSIIWEEPLNVCARSNFPAEDSKDDIIQVYIKNLPRESKALLRDAGIISPALSEQSSTAINYASFLQRIELQGLHEVSTCWAIGSKCYSSSKYKETQGRRLLLYRELCKLFISQSPNLKFSITLDCIKWNEFSHFQQLSNIIPPNSTLEKLICYTGHIKEIYESIGRMFTEIKDLSVNCNGDDNSGLNSLIDQMRETAWSLTISGTRRLPITDSFRKKIRLLTSLKIYSESELVPLEVFLECQFLKILTVDGRSVDPSSVFNIINSTHKTIQSLSIIWYKETNLAKTKDHYLLLSSIPQNCPHLKKLFIPFTYATLHLIIEILNACNTLRYVKLMWHDYPVISKSDLFVWMENLGKSIPSSLQSLRIDGYMGLSVEAVDRFLDQCFWREVRSLKLEIDDWVSPDYYMEDGVDMSERHSKMLEKHISLGTLHESSR
ncbi:4718_t:CDS:1 [Acaulospora morrowiae]|uniref:4718_t:CDS:1 n=1 Tax=Acaulospora morrowiae TaxID=94023 RepID=A0A9N9FMC5_9GLOM|nr:4718_t:CDS:1 [Acaulospora morrowiae]